MYATFGESECLCVCVCVVLRGSLHLCLRAICVRAALPCAVLLDCISFVLLFCHCVGQAKRRVPLLACVHYLGAFPCLHVSLVVSCCGTVPACICLILSKGNHYVDARLELLCLMLSSGKSSMAALGCNLS